MRQSLLLITISTYLLLSLVGVVGVSASNSEHHTRTWLRIENDDTSWTVEGPHEINSEYPHCSPSGTVTELYAGTSAYATCSGTRIILYGQGGPNSCGEANIYVDGVKVASSVQWPLFPA